MNGTDVLRSDLNDCTMDLCRQVCASLFRYEEWPAPWPARTLIIAAGKGGFIPSSDHPHDALKLAGIGSQANEATIAMTHSELRHPWNRQAPLLFAATVRAWLKGHDLPQGFVPL